MKEEIKETQINQESIKRMSKWSQALKQDTESTNLFDEVHPNKEMTIKELMTELNLYEMRDKFGVFVNGEQVESDFVIVKPSDDIIFLPFTAGKAGLEGGPTRELIKNLEEIIIASLDSKQKYIDEFLTKNRIETIINL